MVTAGVYLIGRFHPIFEIALTAADIAAIVGLVTLLIAATIALVVTDLKRIIAYSTMSQIGYMIMGVGIGAYSAAFFHLMTHAFFKALLFMAAGSVIGAMANRQNIDLMGGFRKSLPFTCAMLLIGCLRPGGVPRHLGLLLEGRDPRLRRAPRRLLLGLRDRRLRRRADDRLLRLPDRLPGRLRRARPEARELEQGHIHHAEPANPATGEPEDTDVGFPGAEHHIAERRVADEDRDERAGVRRVFAGLVQVPGVDAVVEQLPRGLASRTRRLYCDLPSDAAEWRGLGDRRRSSRSSASRSRLSSTCATGTTRRLQERFAAVHTFLENKWYFDEAIDMLVVRPGAGARALGQRGPSSATSSTASSAAPPAPPRAPTPLSAQRSPATCAATRCCC